MRAPAAALGALFVLAACGTAPVDPKAPGPSTTLPSGGDCRMAGAQFAVGRTVDNALLTEAAQRASAKTARVLRPNQVITMEFNAQRLNLEVDKANRVVAVRCG